MEAHAAVAAAERGSRVDAAKAKLARVQLDAMWQRVFVIELDLGIMEGAAACVREYNLRACDAVHCASAMSAGSVDLLAVSGDRQLLEAWMRGGLAVAVMAGWCGDFPNPGLIPKITKSMLSKEGTIA